MGEKKIIEYGGFILRELLGTIFAGGDNSLQCPLFREEGLVVGTGREGGRGTGSGGDAQGGLVEGRRDGGAQGRAAGGGVGSGRGAGGERGLGSGDGDLTRLA